MSEAAVITIDGPSGVGKGTMAHLLAKALGFHLLDSGALYRLVALASLRRGTEADQIETLETLARDLDARFGTDEAGEPRIHLEGEDVTEAIRAEAVGERASVVAALPGVREALLARQRAFRRPPGLVADGRDMGTVVFPGAELKVFLTASAEERARRRYNQLIDKGIGATLADLLRDIRVRDERDASRAAAPLRPARDALVLDTSTLSIDQVLRALLDAVEDRLGVSPHSGPVQP
jgi:cytidylate kinase